MTFRTFIGLSLRHFWRSHLVVAAGVATAVAVLGGALLVGDSVRGTLRDLAVARLGATDLAVASPTFFGDDLAARLAADSTFTAGFAGVAPLVALDGFVTAQTSGRRAGHVRVYGVDDRFWRFHGLATPVGLEPRRATVSPALADETGVAVGEPILVRVELPSDIPLESLHGRKEDPGRSIRATVSGIQPPAELGEFTLSQSQGRVRAVFVALEWLREQLEIGRRANTLVIATRGSPADATDRLAGLLRRLATPADAGLTIRTSASSPALLVGSDAGLIDEPRAAAVTAAAAAAGLDAEPLLTYLANSIRIGAREVPYSLVTARDLAGLPATPRSGGDPPILLNTWAARELSAAPGDRVELDYYLWAEPGQLVTRTAAFALAGIVPVDAGDRELAPVYPGITDSPTLDSWDPPFPIDLRRVRPADEAYWKTYRTTPKAFVALEDGQRLWGSRYGRVTSIRIDTGAPAAGADGIDPVAFGRALGERLDAVASGLQPRPVRSEALAAATGVTDFGEYFAYFSFFLVVSALVLAALFFMLGVEERAREIGLLGAVGAPESFVRRLFLVEALVVAAAGGLVGVAASVAYAGALVALLGTWWVDAVGTSALVLHVTWPSLLTGFAGGVAASAGCTWLAIRGLRSLSVRALLAGAALDSAARAGRAQQRARLHGLARMAAVISAGLVVAGSAGWVAAAGAFFGAAFFALAAGILAVSAWYRRPATRLLTGSGPGAIARLGLRSAAERPSRSALSVTVIASAVFILLAVDTFRKDRVADTGPASGVGGYALVAESLLPVAHDLATAGGRNAVGLSGVDDARFTAFRVRPGDDASCLNLYQPTRPRVLGVGESFVAEGRFRFGRTLAATDAERANPWRLLESTQPDGSVPVIVDANSLTYVLHKSVGDRIDMPAGTGTVPLRVVAALTDSLFQRELLVSERQFVRIFPEAEGYRFWLVDAPAASTVNVAAAFEDRLSAFGVDASPAADRLAEFHRVENTYLTTFQSLGGLGLLVGTVGLSAVLLRNVVSRRKELALLGAVGYRPADVRLMLFAETASLLVAGLLVGGAAALVAAVPAVLERGGRLPLSAAGAAVVALVLAAGLIATFAAARAATRQPLLDALRSE